ncbi:hypothetical protein F5884DRAFT_441358 [Xylogone sp. PMI_703]|nr:hypothetical protein F5884DRAFT_441358 [Xylogone sp. PMI_703]
MLTGDEYLRFNKDASSHMLEDEDLEDIGSDTTKASEETFRKSHLLPHEQFLDPSTSPLAQRRAIRRAQKSNMLWTWLRWALVVGLQVIMIILLLVTRREKGSPKESPVLLAAGNKAVETGGDINGLYKTLSHSYTFLKPEEDKYIPNMTSNDNRMEVRKNWDLLMPLGSGSVLIPDYRDHPLLGNPITDDPIRSGPLFEASWTHALHCLYYAVDSYHQLILNGPGENDNPYHAAHCFEYLRNSILCNLDMTLEGSMSTPNDKDRGQPHVCRNREEAIAWIEARRADDAQDIVGP